MRRRSRNVPFLSVVLVLSSVLLGLYVTSPVYGGGRNVILPRQFGPETPLAVSLRSVLERIEAASRAGDDQALARYVSAEYRAELLRALAEYGIADAGDQSLRGLGVGPRQFDGMSFGVTSGDIVVVAQDFGVDRHRLWRFVWTGFDFVLDRVEFLARMSSRAELERFARKRLITRRD